jgi:type IV secretory pathway TrbD component
MIPFWKTNSNRTLATMQGLIEGAIVVGIVTWLACRVFG